MHSRLAGYYYCPEPGRRVRKSTRIFLTIRQRRLTEILRSCKRLPGGTIYQGNLVNHYRAGGSVFPILLKDSSLRSKRMHRGARSKAVTLSSRFRKLARAVERALGRSSPVRCAPRRSVVESL